MIDSYITLSAPNTGEYKEKGSKFLAYAFPFDHEDELENIMQELKVIHPKARHYCYGYKIGVDSNRYRANDDGEPSGTAGKPIFGQILSHNLTNVIVIVIRYFGGTKLGASGLIHAYKEAAKESLTIAETITKYISKTYKLSFDYEHMGHIMNVLKELEIEIAAKDFTNNCTVEINIRLSQEKLQIQRFKAKVLDKSLDEILEDTEIPFCEIIPIIAT